MKNKIPAIEGGHPVRSDDFLIFGAPDIREEDIEGAVQVLKSGWLSTGPKVKEFEDKFAKYNQSKYAVGTSSCTSALHLAIEALKLPAESEIITTDMSFVATINSILHAGMVPVPVDCHKQTGNILEYQIAKKIGPKTKAILPVHFAGYPCNMDVIKDIAFQHDLKIISDCAHAIETQYNGKSVSRFADLSAYSFYATKNICTGEGGMLLTDNKEYSDIVRQKALHGMTKNAHLRYGSKGFKHYYVDTLGYKYNMMDLVAAIGINQLERVDDNWAKRKDIWHKYIDSFENLPLYLPPKQVHRGKHGHHLFTVQLDLDSMNVDRDFILNALISEGIGTGIHYKAIHEHPYYNKFNWKDGEGKDFPNSRWISERTISLPMSSKLSDKDVEDVITAVTKIINYYKK